MKGDDNIGDKFQEMTEYSRGKSWTGARPERRPAPFKEYEDAKKVKLSDDVPDKGVWKALSERRSRRSFTNEPLTKEKLAKLAFAAQGVTARAGKTLLRTAPSAGALYPVETYLLINRVEGIAPGVYHYNVGEASLELIKKGEHGEELKNASLGQGQAHRAAACFIWTAIPDRSKWKYAQRAWRYIYMDAGHICENVYLACETLDLGCCAMGAFLDDEVNAVLEIDGKDETAIYLAAVGPARQD